MIKSCYIHIPFCSNICSYCDFSKMYYHKKMVNDYLNSLEKEINTYYEGETLNTIYIGGGTPSCLTEEELTRLFTILNKLNKSKEIEYTIEGNFENTTKEKLEIYKKYGVNRLSFGIESIDQNNLLFLNRTLDKNNVLEVLNNSRSLGFNNINVDLMYALPNETLDTLKKDIDYILSLNVEHISTYSLIIEDNTILKQKNIKNINEDLDSEMYELISSELKKNNYIHYEISNFAKKGYESIHNTCYWNNDEYYGFGLGASSYIKNERIENTRSFNKYIEGDFRKNIELIDENSKREYEVLLNFRKKDGINLLDFRKKYHKELKDYYDYNYLIENNLLKEEDNHLFIPEDKWYISNEIIINFLEREKEDVK